MRYNRAVGGTLLSLDDFLSQTELYTWAWLDEWDCKGPEGVSKRFYTEEVFASLREKKIRVAVVSPELHATSPMLLGGESHEDARNRDALFARIKEIVALKPDALCTDYPDAVRKIVGDSR